MPLKQRLVRGFELALGVRGSATIASYVETGAGQLPDGASLLSWSIDSIHDYVFDTGNAAAIRGASLVLTDFDEHIAQGRKTQQAILPIEPEQILYSGGGGGLAVVSSDQLGAIETSLHQAVTRMTRTATCSVGHVPLKQGSFREVKEQLYRRLSRDRTLRGTDATVPMHFFEEPCQVCGRRAAARVQDRTSLAQRKECLLCFDRIERSKRVVDDGKETSGFEDIEAKTGELGVIYLDGNRMGETLAALSSPLDYARFSTALAEGMKRLVYGAIAVYDLKDQPRRGDDEFGYQLPILGGDDLVIVVPGDIAVPMARDLLAGFEKMIDDDEDLSQLPKGPLGACAGVAIGRLPIRHLLDEAEAFLKSAKTRIYREAAEPGPRSCLDFGVIADGRPRRSSHDAPRLAAKDTAQPLLFSGKPYSLKELDELSRRRSLFRDPRSGVATSQLHACWVQALAGPKQLRNHLLYQVGRLPDSWGRLVCALEDSKAPLCDPELAHRTLVPSYGERRIFDIADMLELENLWREPAAQETTHEHG